MRKKALKIEPSQILFDLPNDRPDLKSDQSCILYILYYTEHCSVWSYKFYWYYYYYRQYYADADEKVYADEKKGRFLNLDF